MDLILWRHAEAEDGMPDLARALTARGHVQAWKTADWLDRHLPNHCRVFTSPAVRTVQTAEALGRKFTVHANLGTSTTPEKILAVAGWPDNPDPVLIVGHQPTLGMLAALLITGEMQEWTVRKGNVWWISRKDKNEPGSSYVRTVITPDFLAKRGT